MMLRVLESFFRRWWLYLLPVLLIGGFGVSKVLSAKSQYKSEGSINVASGTLLGSLSDVRGNPNYGYETPAQATASNLNSLLKTETFVSGLATSAGLDAVIQSGTITLDDIRAAIAIQDAGPNLVTVEVQTSDATISQAIANATIDNFIQGVVDSEVADSTAAETFYTNLAKQRQADVEEARTALTTYLNANPAPGPGSSRPDAQVVEITRLQGVLEQAQERYNSSLTKSDDARLSIEQATSDVTQRLKVVDQPQVPVSPESGLKKTIFTFATFLALGLLLSIATVIVGTIFDHSFRSPADITERLGVPVLAVVPEAKAAKARKAKAGSQQAVGVPSSGMGIPENVAATNGKSSGGRTRQPAFTSTTPRSALHRASVDPGAGNAEYR
jgi:uncharacterized protein involved in exopolysaccharide biosynthesis